MGIKDFFKKKDDDLSEELRLLPRDTRKRILENVNRRRNEILEERILEKQLKYYGKEESVEAKQGKWAKLREGMRKRREELKKQGILKPLIRYDKKNFQSPLEEMSRKARAEEIKRLEDQRNKLKAGNKLSISNGVSDNLKLKIKPLNLKDPQPNLRLAKKRGKWNNGFV